MRIFANCNSFSAKGISLNTTTNSAASHLQPSNETARPSHYSQPELQRMLEQHRQRAEHLVALAEELSSSLSLPDLVKSFTTRAARLLGARSAALALAQGAGLRVIAVSELEADKELRDRLNSALTEICQRQQGAIAYMPAHDFLGESLMSRLAWKDITFAKLHGTGDELLGALCLVDRGTALTTNDEQLLHGLLAHASMALENSRLFTRIMQSSKQWAEIFDSISDIIIVHNSEHRVTRTNRSLSDLLHRHPSDLIGNRVQDLFFPDGSELEACPFCSHAISGGKNPQDGSREFVHPVTERVYLISSSKVHGSTLEGPSTVHVLKDVTESREVARKYHELFDNIHEGAYFSTPEGRFVEVNDALVRMLGYDSREELMAIDIPTQLYISPEHRTSVTRSLENQGDLRNCEETLRRKDGSWVQVLENSFAVRDKNGNIVQLRGVILDISKIKEVQSQLQREHDFNTQVLNHTQSIILVADTAGLVSYANRKYFASPVGRQRPLLGTRLMDIVPPSHRRVFEEAFEKALSGEPISNLELPVACGHEIVGRYSLSLSAMRDQQGIVNSVVTVMSDVSDASMLQAKLVQTEKMVAVGQLVSGVAHEVNNPLTSIMGFADLMLDDPALPGRFRNDLQVIIQEAQRTKEIVQNLLSFARQTPAERKLVQVNDLLKKTVSLRAYDLSSHAVEVVENLESDLPEISGDPHQLQQVFLNILNNAYDAVRETSHPGIIQINTQQMGELIEIEFRDNGPGVKNLERIFDPFFTTKEVGKGTGLGLSICYGIVREHGGEILCENNTPQPGAIFRLRFPRARVAERAAAGAG